MPYIIITVLLSHLPHRTDCILVCLTYSWLISHQKYHFARIVLPKAVNGWLIAESRRNHSYTIELITKNNHANSSKCILKSIERSFHKSNHFWLSSKRTIATYFRRSNDKTSHRTPPELTTWQSFQPWDSSLCVGNLLKLICQISNVKSISQKCLPHC